MIQIPDNEQVPFERLFKAMIFEWRTARSIRSLAPFKSYNSDLLTMYQYLRLSSIVPSNVTCVIS